NRLAIRHQEWLQAGQVGLASAIAGEKPLDELAQCALRFMAEYLDAQAGAIFIRNGEGFHRHATYGVPAAAVDVPEHIGPGDGLLGQAVADRRNFAMSEVPEGYLYYGSSLGRAKPSALLIAVTHADDMVNAVIELGLVPERLDDAQELLDRVGGQLGVAI